MNLPGQSKSATTQAIEIAIRLGLIFLIFAWCLQILSPFISLIAWGAIIAVAIYPLFLKLADKLGIEIILTPSPMVYRLRTQCGLEWEGRGSRLSHWIEPQRGCATKPRVVPCNGPTLGYRFSDPPTPSGL